MDDTVRTVRPRQALPDVISRRRRDWRSRTRGSVVLESSLYRQVLGLSQGVLVDGVTAVLELHSPQAGAGAGVGDCPQCQVPSPCPTVHVLNQRLGIATSHGGRS